MALYSVATLPLLTFFWGLRSFGWEREVERGGEGGRRGEGERRRGEVGEIERRESTGGGEWLCYKLAWLWN